MSTPAASALDRLAGATASELVHQVEALTDQIAGLKRELEHHGRLATLGTIAGLIAHEFNNILTPVLSYAQMALAAPADTALREKALVRAVEGSERAAGIAAAILGFVRDDSRDEAQGAGPAATAAVAETARQALLALGRGLDRDGIELAFHVEPSLRGAIQPLALQHVLLNLILNARSAMLPAGGTLTIACRPCSRRPEPPDGAVTCSASSTWRTASSTVDNPATDPSDARPWLLIEVADTGRGMTPERLATLFTPFVSDRPVSAAAEAGEGDRARAERRSGTGLGLLVCARLLRDAGGMLHATSAFGRGTTMSIAIPAAHPIP